MNKRNFMHACAPCTKYLDNNVLFCHFANLICLLFVLVLASSRCLWSWLHLQSFFLAIFSYSGMTALSCTAAVMTTECSAVFYALRDTSKGTRCNHPFHPFVLQGKAFDVLSLSGSLAAAFLARKNCALDRLLSF